MITIKRLNIAELKEAALLSNSVFRSEGQEWMEVAFPYIFQPSLVSHSFGAFQDRELISFMGLVPFSLKIGQATLPVFSLGSVCTHIAARGQGYASTLLEQVYQYIDQAGASLLFVSGDRSLYTRANCYHFGATTSYVLDSSSATRLLANATLSEELTSKELTSKEPLLREYESSDLLAMLPLAQSRLAHYETSIHDFSLLLEAEAYAREPKLKHKVLVAEKNGQIKAFLVLGTEREAGDALKKEAVAIEWAGEAKSIALLMASAVQRYSWAQLEATVPWQEEQLQEILQEQAIKQEEQGNQGTVYIVNPDRLLEQLRPYLKQKNEAISEQLYLTSIDNGRTEVGIGLERVSLEPGELVDLLFSDKWAREREQQTGQFPELKESLRQGFKEIFPIPLPYTAGLHYI